MFLIDTNVLSELRRQSPQVRGWMAATPGLRLYCSVISLGEIEKGIERSAQCPTRTSPHVSTFGSLALCQEFGDRALAGHRRYRTRLGADRSRSKSRDTADALIAATAIVHGLTLVTRNTRDFEDLPLTLFNPWQR